MVKSKKKNEIKKFQHFSYLMYDIHMQKLKATLNHLNQFSDHPSATSLIMIKNVED